MKLHEIKETSTGEIVQRTEKITREEVRKKLLVLHL